MPNLRLASLICATMVLGSLSLAVDAYAEARVRFGGAATGALTGEPTAFEPLEASGHAEATLVALVFDALFRIDEGGHVVPHLAAGLPIATKPGTIAIPIREGVRFHDQRGVSADDVVASLLRLRSSVSGPWILAGVGTIQAAGNTVVLQTDRDVADLAIALASPQAAITRAAASRIGTGPYRYARVSPRDRVVELTAFYEHFGGRPYLDKLIFTWFAKDGDEARRYEAGRSHWSYRGAIAFAGHQPKFPTVEIEGTPAVLSYLGFGARISGRPVAVRKALSLAIGRSGIVAALSGDRLVPTVAPLLPQLGGRAASKSELAGSSRDAKAALVASKDEFAARLLGGEEKLSLAVDASRLDDRVIAEKVIAALYRVGIDVHLDVLGASEFRKKVAAREADLFVGQMVPLTPLALDAYAAAFLAGNDPGLARRKAKGPVDLETASALFESVMPIVPLVLRAPRVHHQRALRGLAFDGLGLPTLADGFISSDNDPP